MLGLIGSLSHSVKPITDTVSVITTISFSLGFLFFLCQVYERFDEHNFGRISMQTVTALPQGKGGILSRHSRFLNATIFLPLRFDGNSDYI